MVSRQTVERARDLRRRLTPPEARLWVRLRREQLRGLKFRRQHPVGPYVLDFYCAEAKLAEDVRLNLDGVLEFIARTAMERCGGHAPPPLRGPPPHSPRGERGGDD